MLETAFRTVSPKILLLAALFACACTDSGPDVPGGGSGGSGGGAGMHGAGAGGSSGMAGGVSGSGSTPAPGTFGAVAEIMHQNCGAPACHGGGPDGQELIYTNPATLHNVLMTTSVESCGPAFLVKPGDPANSALIKLPNWDCTDQSGGPFVMPQGCIEDPCLTAPELSSITAWIMAGALP